MMKSRAIFVAVSLIGMVPLARPAHGSGFTAFAEDEDACRHAGAVAIGPAAGPTAARRYDAAYGRCMAAHVRARQIGAYRRGQAQDADEAPGNPHSFDFPDAFYSVPYAAPGYGYDGFSY